MPEEDLKHANDQQFPDQFYQDPYGVDRYVVQEKPLFSWKSQSKSERPRQRREMLQYVFFAVLVCLIIFFIGEWLLAIVAAIASIILITNLLTPPTLLNCMITTIGIKVEETYYYWPQLSQFWFEAHHDGKQEEHILFLRNIVGYPQIIRLRFRTEEEDELQKALGRYLLFKKPQRTRWEKFTDRVQEKFPLRFD
jgi:hypothetical protein